MKYLYIIYAVIIFNINAWTQDLSTKGQNFWFAFSDNIDLGPNGPPVLSIYVYGEESGTAIIKSKLGDFEYSINYQAKEYTELVVKDSIFYPMNSDTITEFGLELNTTSVVDAHAYHFRNARSEASILLSLIHI